MRDLLSINIIAYLNPDVDGTRTGPTASIERLLKGSSVYVLDDCPFCDLRSLILAILQVKQENCEWCKFDISLRIPEM
jgi:hypothetical protein